MGDDLRKLTEDIEGFTTESDYKLGDLASGAVPDPKKTPDSPEPAAPTAKPVDGAPEPAEPGAAESGTPGAAQPPAAAPPASAAPAVPSVATARRVELDDEDEDDAPIDPHKALEEFKRSQGLSGGAPAPAAPAAESQAPTATQQASAAPAAGPAVDAASQATESKAAAPPQPREELLKLHRPDYGAQEMAAVLDVLKSGWLTKGPQVTQFENEFAQRVATPHALGLNSCTAALHTAFMAAGLRAGDEVIVPAMTFAATANVVVHCGATPVFCDVLPDTHCIDPAHAISLINRRTRAIAPVHFAGIPCDMQPLWEAADKNNLFIVEDCAHAVETEYRGRPVGACPRTDAPGAGSRFGAYSFYATKNLITGEGGMLTCVDAADLERSRVLSLHGMSVDAWKRYAGAEGELGDFKLYDIVAAGYKYNMFELQAALGLVQLHKLDSNWELRRARVAHYDALLAAAFPGGEFTGLRYPDYGKSAHHLYIARLSEELAGAEERGSALRDQVIRGLRARKVEAYLHYICLTGTEFYRERFSTSPKQTPQAASIARRAITLPLFPTMSESDVEYVVAMLRQSLDAART